MSAESLPIAERCNEQLADLDEQFDEIARLARARLSSQRFFEQVLTRVITLLPALGGFVWRKQPNRPAAFDCVAHVLAPSDAPDFAPHGQRLQILQGVVQTGRSQSVEVDHGATGNDASTGSGKVVLLLCPLLVDDQVFGVLEVVQRTDIGAQDRQGQLRLLQAVADLVTDFEINRQRHALQEESSKASDLNRFLQRIHSGVELRQTAYVMANEGRGLIGCDRLSIAVSQGGRAKLLSISGVDTFDRRAHAVRILERLTSLAARTGEPLWYGGGTEDLPPQIAAHMDTYVDAAHPRLLGIIPLRDPADDQGIWRRLPLGLLVVESFEELAAVEVQNNLATIEDHCRLALNNAIVTSRTPFVGLGRFIGRLGGAGYRARILAAAISAAALIAVLILGRVPLKIEARGELRPLTRRNVFAPLDGEVRLLHVRHDQAVAQGQVLAELRSADLDLEFRRVQGEMDGARERLRAVESARVFGSRGDEEMRRPGQLSAAQEELQHLLSSYTEQLEILRDQREALTLRSPIDGRVLSWDLDKTLESRPVRRGEQLMTVADTQGVWLLELEVPDHEMGHVLDAQAARGRDLAVAFVLETRPDATFVGRIREVAQLSERDGEGEAMVVVRVGFDREQVAELRPGATAIAKIHCGNRALGYVWCRQLLEFAQTRILF